jgi:spermidine synthase
MPGHAPAFFRMSKPTERGFLIHTCHDPYGQMAIFDREGMRSLYFDSGACQSSLRLSDPTALVLAYTQSMLAGLLFRPLPQRILLIGLGGGALARFLHHHLPSTQIVCVETRAVVVELAHAYFGLPVSSRLRIQIGEGADYMRVAKEREFDMILIDAFDSAGVHSSVCTPEFHADCRRSLRPGGVLAINLWNTPEAPCKQQLDAIKAGFAGQILRLPVEQRANLIALGLDQQQTRQTLKQLCTTAQQLTDQLGIDFGKYLRKLQHCNRAELRSGLSAQAESFSQTVHR